MIAILLGLFSSVAANLACDGPTCIDPSAIPTSPTMDLDLVNSLLSNQSAPTILKWAHNTFGEGLVLQSSFGIRSAAFIHMVVSVVPDIPVVLVDTGFLPQRTLDFAYDLQRRLNLNLKVYRPEQSAEEMEQEHGRLWKMTEDWAHDLYGKLRKVEPMQRALKELKATAVLTGLQAVQTDFRKKMKIVNPAKGLQCKVVPLLNWDKSMIEQYLAGNDLPYHPYKEQGYETVGDKHSSRPMQSTDTSERATRFFGAKTECGMHTLM